MIADDQALLKRRRKNVSNRVGYGSALIFKNDFSKNAVCSYLLVFHYKISSATTKITSKRPPEVFIVCVEDDGENLHFHKSED